MIAVVSDGTRVLGLGDIGQEAAIPVMEGKALLFKYLGGVDAWPITLDTKEPIIFACANPIPEIYLWEAKKGGARIVATGRSDFPNQVNNSLCFPAIFRGTLDVMASTNTDEMCIASALELAKCAEDKGLKEDYILPTMGEWEVYPRQAVATALKAIEQIVARIKLPKDELFQKASETIRRARMETEVLIEKGIIPTYREK